MSTTEHPAITKTKQWLETIVIGLNFCPFAKKEFVNNTIRYHKSSLGRSASEWTQAGAARRNPEKGFLSV